MSLWRALWNTLNDVLLPREPLYSNLLTWSAGVTLSLLLLTLERPLTLLVSRARRCGVGKELNR